MLPTCDVGFFLLAHSFHLCCSKLQNYRYFLKQIISSLLVVWPILEAGHLPNCQNRDF